MRIAALILFVLFFFPSFGQEQNFPTNFHEVHEGILYRSGQPNRKEMLTLESFGVKTLVNLRYRINDRREIKGTSLKEFRIKMRAQSVDEEDMINGLKAILSSDKIVLVHCLHGSDRTGALIACYRMVVQDWSKEDAINEFLEEKYSYNKMWFPNLEDFLINLDINKMKEQLNQAIND